MENSRFLKIVIIVLLLVNISTLAYLWMGRPHRMPPGGPPPREDAFNYLRRTLNMDEQEVRQYEQLRDQHHEAIENIQRNARQLRERMFDMLNKPDADSLAVKAISDSIAATQQQIELITFNHFKQVRAILHPDQQKKFDEVIQQALRMMAPPQGPPPPPQGR